MPVAASIGRRKRVQTIQEPKSFIATGTGTTPDRVASFSVSNIGETPGTLGGIPIEAGETDSWSASAGKLLSAVPFDATGTKVKITYVIDTCDTEDSDSTIRPLMLIYTQSEAVTEIAVQHNWGIDPVSVLVTTEDKAKTELSWQFSQDANSVIFRSTSPTTFRAILFGFRNP